FILFNLTGCFATDKTFANRTGLFDISTQEWSKELIDVYGVDKNKLCKIVEVGDTIGKTTQKITQILGVENSIDVISSGGDQQCASVGLGCLDVGDIEVNSGTGSFIIGVSDKPVFDEKMRVNCNISSIQGKWIVEGSVLSAGRAVDYINDLMFKDESEKHSYENINKFAALSPKGARGLRIIPHFAGSGTPDWDSSAKAEIKNLSFANKKEDFARGIFEGIAIEMENCIEIVAQIIGKENEAISVAGGLTKSQTYNEIQADVYGKRTLVSSNCEATGIGAFIVASVKIGLFKSYREAFNSATKQDVINAYEPDLVANQMYKKIFK
ncbi:MAG: FGGY-family carbohydrate kinase, partial [Clostridia bacterium]